MKANGESADVTNHVKAVRESMPHDRLIGAIAMNAELRATWLRIFLRVVSVGYVTTFIPWITLILLDAPILAAGGRLAPLVRFQPYNADYESMLTAIHLVWAIMLWRASNNPLKQPLFIEFTIWTHAAHGLVMVIATPIQKGFVMMFIEALPFFAIAAVLWWLRPENVFSRGESPVAARQHAPASLSARAEA
jgi:hypothetical protein